ncbi:hypothetical protein ACFLTH_00395 [Bacteroidota bacterium]
MAKQHSFADKAKGKQKAAQIAVKVVKAVKSVQGNYKFQEKFVNIDDISKVETIK